jgi:hypothetical protein
MAKSKDVYIQCLGDHGIKVHSADGKLTKRFDIAAYDTVSGRQTNTGFTRLTTEEYETLFRESKVFSHFIELKTLVKYDSLPEDALTPHEALVSAKKEAAEHAKLVAELKAENEALKAENEALKKSAEATIPFPESSGGSTGTPSGPSDGSTGTSF